MMRGMHFIFGTCYFNAFYQVTDRPNVENKDEIYNKLGNSSLGQ